MREAVPTISWNTSEMEMKAFLGLYQRSPILDGRLLFGKMREIQCTIVDLLFWINNAAEAMDLLKLPRTTTLLGMMDKKI